MTDTTTPEHSDAGLAAAVAQHYLARRNPQAAWAALEPFVSAVPEPEQDRRALADAFCALARVATSRREMELAERSIEAARWLEDGPSVWRAEAALAASRGEWPVARDAWRRVVAALPENGADWLALAQACQRTGEVDRAVEAYLRAAAVDPSDAIILNVAERVADLAPYETELPDAKAMRIAIIGSSTLDHLGSYLEVACRQAGLVPTFYVGPFGQYAQDILNPTSELYTFAPDVIILAVHGRALFPDLYDNPFDLDVDARRIAAVEAVDRMVGLLKQLNARTQALVLCHTFATPQYSPLGALDLRDEFGQAAIFEAINAELAERVRRELPTVQLIDENRVYGRIGKRNVTDARMWFLARIGLGEAALGALSAEYMRYIKPLKGLTRKCLVLDLDNTLWGGVVGEDGPHGIALGQEAPGNAFVAFQRAILDLWKRGVILAVASKNNEADAMEVLEHHPDMVLRPSHFAALRINWVDKAANLRSIAVELNIGLDSLVFVDDNPTECAMMRAQLPEVLTVQLPPDPALYRATLLDLTDFDTLGLTEEDRQRGKLYAQRRERQQWEAGRSGDLNSYLADLGLVVEVDQADTFAIPRIAQLIGKTNQFNLTTRRHTEAAVRAFAASSEYRVFGARVRDRFGEHGLVGAAIVAARGDTWEVDTLLLSCRVLGCGVETAVLSALVGAARAGGARTLRGLYIPTAKNAPARDLYAAHGFTLTEEHDGAQHWVLDVTCGDVAVPQWVTLHVGKGILAAV